jgi:hypothetical protein
MTKEEFAATCAKCGYASYMFALAYAADKDELTDEDYIEVYRQANRRHINAHDTEGGKWRDMLTPDLCHVRTTKHYIRLGADSREREST